MAEDFLGISAHVDIDELVTGLESLISLLEKAGAVSSETASQMTSALAAMQTNLNNGFTTEGLDQLFADLEGIKGKVAETINAFAEGNTSLNWDEVTQSVAAYQVTTVEALNATLAAEEAEAEHVETLKASLQGLLEQRERLSMTEDDAIGLEDEIRRTSAELERGQALLATYSDRVTSLADASEEGRRLADTIQSVNTSLSNAAESTNLTIDTSSINEAIEEIDRLKEVVAGYKSEYERLVELYDSGGTSIDTVVSAWERYSDAMARSAEKTGQTFEMLDGHMGGLEETITSLNAEADRMFSGGSIEKAAALRAEAEKLNTQLEADSSVSIELANQMVQLAQAEEEAATALERFGDIEMPDSVVQQYRDFKDSIKESVSEVSDEVKGFGSKIGDWLTGHGKAQEAVGKLKDSLNNLPGPLGGAVSGFKNMIGAVKMFMATPIGRVLGVIVFLLQAFKTWTDKSAEGQRVMAKVTAYVGSILESLTGILVKVGGYLYHAFADATGPMNAFARGLVTTLKLAVKSASDLLGGLGDILRGIGKMFTGDFSGGWDTLKSGASSVAKGLKEAGEGFINAIATGINGIRGVVSMAGDGIGKVWNSNLLNTVKSYHNTALEATKLSKEQSEYEENITKNRERQVALGNRINAARNGVQQAENVNDLSVAVAELYNATSEKYADLIAQQEKEVAMLQKKNSLHEKSLKDITAEQVANLQLLTLKAKQEAALRAIDILEEKQEKKILKREEQERKAEERKEKAAVREAERQKKAEERREKAAAKAAERYAKLSAKEKEAADKASAKLLDTVEKSAREQAKEQQDAALKIEDATVRAMKDGAAKRYALLQLEHKKELAEISRNTEERVVKETERQKKIFNAANDQRKKLHLDPLEFSLDEEPIKKIKEEGEELARLQQQIWDVEELKGLSDKYQDYYDQRIAIEERYNEDISKLQAQRNAAAERNDFEEVERISRMIANAEREKNAKSVSLSVSEIKNRPENIEAYKDLGKVSAETIKKLIGQWREAEKTAEKAGLPVKEYRDEIEKLQKQLSQNMPFVALVNAVEQAKKAQEELDKAKKKLQEVQESGGQKLFFEKKGEHLWDWSFSFTTQAEAQEEVTKAQENYTQATHVAIEASNKAIAVIDNLRSSFEKLGKSIGGEVGDIFGFIGSLVGFTTQGIKSALSQVENYDKAKKELDDITAKHNALKAAAEAAGDATAKTGLEGELAGARLEAAAAKAQIWIAAMTAMVQIIGAVQKLLPTADDLYESYAKKVREVNNLRRAVDEYKLAILASQQAERNWFSVSGLTSLTDAYERHGKVVEAYYNKLFEAQEKYKNKSSGIGKALPYLAAAAAVIASAVVTVGTMGTATPVAALMLGSIGTALGSAATAVGAAVAGTIAGAATAGMQAAVAKITYNNGQVAAKDNLRIQTRHRTWFRGEQTQDLADWAREQLNAELFDDEGLINLEAAETILDRYGNKLVGETKATLEDLIKLRKEYDEFMEQVEKYVSDLYSPLVDNMTDALFEWLKTGTDVLYKFKQSAKDTFADIAKDMVKQMLMTQVFDEYKENLKKIYAAYAATRNRDILISGVMQSTDKFLTHAENELPIIQEALAKINDQFAARGFDLTQSSDEGTGAYKAISSFSQEQGDELNGRLTAIQIGQQQGIIQRTAMLEIMSVHFEQTVRIGDGVGRIANEITDIREMQFDSLRRLTEISIYTSVLPSMASDISDMRADIRNKL